MKLATEQKVRDILYAAIHETFDQVATAVEEDPEWEQRRADEEFIDYVNRRAEAVDALTDKILADWTEATE